MTADSGVSIAAAPPSLPLVDMRVRLQMHQHVSQAGEFFNKPILDQVADAMALIDRQLSIDLDVNVGEILQAGLPPDQRIAAATTSAATLSAQL